MNAKAPPEQKTNETACRLDDLVWNCCAKMSRGEKVNLEDYLTQCRDEKSREEFQLEICTAALLDASIALQVDRFCQGVELSKP